MDQKIRNRLKSPVVWMSIVAQFLSILVLVGIIGQEWSNAITGVVSAVLEMLTIFGVLNNPTEANKF
jgi:uncharacterized membrane protein